MNAKELEQEFLRKVTKSQGIIHKVCRMYCTNEENRKDLFQEILIQLWKSYPSFRGASKISTWMYRVGLNVAIQHLRKTKKRQQFTFLTTKFEDVQESGPAEKENEKLQLMYQAIATLNKVEKAIIMLYLENKQNDEIAEIIGISQNYVRVKMHRIKLKLKETVNIY